MYIYNTYLYKINPRLDFPNSYNHDTQNLLRMLSTFVSMLKNGKKYYYVIAYMFGINNCTILSVFIQTVYFFNVLTVKNYFFISTMLSTFRNYFQSSRHAAVFIPAIRYIMINNYYYRRYII